MKKHLFLILLAAIVLLASCTGGKQNAAETDSARESAPEKPAELPLPSIPESLATPESRAAYLALHFWDGMDFSDQALSLDTAFMEQSFANYLSVFPVLAQEADKVAAVGALLQRAVSDSVATDFLLNVVDKYLRDPNSPMRDEDLLIVFYNQILQTPRISGWQRERTARLLDDAMRNRLGTVAADFTFLLRKGGNATLHSHCAGGPTLLVFYNPDCEHCKEVMSVLEQMPIPAAWSVLVVDTEQDKARWDETKGALPGPWEVGFATTDITGAGLYDLSAMPTLYLLDGHLRVLLKDPTLEELSAFWGTKK